jgi:thioredoxin 1
MTTCGDLRRSRGLSAGATAETVRRNGFSMIKGTTTNIVAILAVLAVVAGAAWYRSQRDAPPTEEASPSADPAHAKSGALREPAATATDPPGESASTGRLPRLVDLGADKCIPCKKLAPILEEVRREYQGKLTVEVIDVWKNPAAGRPYNIRLIPTQILYDRDGEEVWRHEGFISKEDLKALFAEKVGVE